MQNEQTFFTKTLLKWSKKIDRPMPWKGEKNPYLIWLSEIILQQTRVEQGRAYFLKFKEKYPTITDLAHAPEEEVLKMWEGLGYYSRVRNLHFTAKQIAEKYDGVFPSTYPEILELKGVGAYTAAAIASFAYDLPHAVVDGNVYRVLSRFFGIRTPIDSTQGKKQFTQLAQELLATKQAATYNQAIMDFGAIQCMPKVPLCKTCPMSTKCLAYQSNIVNELPIKEKKLKKRTRYFNYLVLENGDLTYVEKRLEKDIWQHLFQFPMIETSHLVEFAQLNQTSDWQQIFGDTQIITHSVSAVFKQTLSHQYIVARFWKISIDQAIKNEKYIQTNQKNLTTFAFPKVIDRYLKDNSLLLF